MKMRGLVFFIGMASLVSMAVFGGAKSDDASRTKSAVSGGVPPYLNTGDTFPIVKQGENITLSVATVYNSAMGAKTDDIWFWKYCSEKMNINFEVEQIMDSAAEERKNLMFASGDLKDIVFHLGINATDMVTYGQEEHLLYNLNDLLKPEYAPNILGLMEKMPDLRANISCPDGGIYGLPVIFEKNDTNSVPRTFINTDFLQKVGLKYLETLDDFYTVLKAFKEKDPSGTGKIVPLERTGPQIYFSGRKKLDCSCLQASQGLFQGY
jgi:putative aldouronate transport system substrate-binding protein